MKRLIPLALVLALTSCRIGCVVEDTLTAAISASVTAGLQCNNFTAVQTSVRAAVQKLNLCPTPTQKKLILGPICSLIAGALIQNLANAEIPAAWECKPGAATTTLTSLAVSACNQIPL